MSEGPERLLATLPVRHPGGGYEVALGHGLLSGLGRRLVQAGQRGAVAIITDENVALHYADAALSSITSAGLSGAVCVMPAGEGAKHLGTTADLYTQLAKSGLGRDGAVVALGGGVVGDVAGFVAATYLRGVPLWQVPTSLLAMADSSVGGKVGVDLGPSKNLVGAFKQPAGVVIDIATLTTLPRRELRCGLAEIVKAALIAGGDAYQRIQRLTDSESLVSQSIDADGLLLKSLIDAIELKIRLVEQDPHEHGVRALLNLGHTFAHGIESFSDFRVRHGEAVALGLVAAARLSQRLGCCTDALAETVAGIVTLLGLPARLGDCGLAADLDLIWSHMLRDKKRRGGRLRFVLLRAPGDVFLSEAADAAAADSLDENARAALATLA